MTCGHCGEDVLPPDDMANQPGVCLIRGETLHVDCATRLIAGSLGHQLRLCHCPRMPGIMDDPPGLTKREAARAAAAFFRERDPVTELAKVRACRACGCTDRDCSGCIEKTGMPCHWVEADLCSACVPLTAKGGGR